MNDIGNTNSGNKKSGSGLGTLATIVTIIAGIVGMYFAYRSDKREEDKYKRENPKAYVDNDPEPVPKPLIRQDSIPGLYPIASRKYLVDSDYYNMSAHDLMIMRNEIFARNGYEFQGELKPYFESKTWYQAIKKISRNDDHIYFNEMSDIERENVQILKARYDDIYIPGIYPFMSTKYITSEDLKGKSEFEKDIMRNEPFARKGYSFKGSSKAKRMLKYFQKQDWYVSIDKVKSKSGEIYENSLNDFEKYNIKFINEH